MTSFANQSSVSLVSDMQAYDSDNVRIFQGQYVSSQLSSKGRLKWIQLRNSQGQWSIKLSKAIAYPLAHTLKPGMILRVWARPKDDYFKGLMIIPVETDSSRPEDNYPPLQPHSSPNRPPSLQARSSNNSMQCTLKVCTNGKCKKRGSQQLLYAFKAAIAAENLDDTVMVQPTGCLKNCQEGPAVMTSPHYAIYTKVQNQDIHAILSSAL